MFTLTFIICLVCIRPPPLWETRCVLERLSSAQLTAEGAARSAGLPDLPLRNLRAVGRTPGACPTAGSWPTLGTRPWPGGIYGVSGICPFNKPPARLGRPFLASFSQLSTLPPLPSQVCLPGTAPWELSEPHLSTEEPSPEQPPPPPPPTRPGEGVAPSLVPRP